MVSFWLFFIALIRICSLLILFLWLEILVVVLLLVLLTLFSCST